MENKSPENPSQSGQLSTPDKLQQAPPPSTEDEQPSTPDKQQQAPPPSTPEANNEAAALAEFRRKHPDLAPGNILQRKLRLERGHKYFDSGDYNMAKAKSAKEGVSMDVHVGLTEELDGEMGDDHPTPDTIPHKKYPPAPGVSKLAF